MSHIVTPENKPKTLTVAIVTTILDDWGGSEELWRKAIPFLQQSGHRILVFKKVINYHHPAFADLSKSGVELVQFGNSGSRTTLFFKEVISKAKKRIKKSNAPLTQLLDTRDAFQVKLEQYRPDFVLVSQSINFDGLFLASQCQQLNIPYAVIAQKAVDFYWPAAREREYMSKTLLKAKKVFFVSNHNRILTEEQFGIRLGNYLVVYNPVKLSGKVIPYPETTTEYRLACIARLFLLDKGQDILIRILSHEKWKNRPITISFVGAGEDLHALKAMADLLGVENVEFKGQVEDIEGLWKEYHAFILPARSEGMPLAMIEAMAAGRTVIVTRAGGNAEVVCDGINGFIGHANEESFDEAMERAWKVRDRWKEIGQKASESVAAIVSRCPEKEFANHINEALNDK